MKRKRTESNHHKASRLAPESNNERVVLDHYNQRHEQGTKKRRESKIYHLRSLNNWIKAILFRKYVHHNAVALDFCAGKGGDLQKWNKAHIKELFYVDHAMSLIQMGINRYNGMIDSSVRRIFPCSFIAADCFDHNLVDILPDDVWFDVVSSQFAIHYAFESEARARAMLHNVSSRLKQGGYFIGTTPDADRLVKRWRNEPQNHHSFGNSLFQVRFKPETPEQLQKKLDPKKPFGVKYFFNLDDAIDQCPEFLLHMPTFVRLAKEYGLSLVLEMDFHEFFVYEHDKSKQKDLLQRMRVLNEQHTIPLEEWEIASLYLVFVFRKTAKTDHVERKSPSAKRVAPEDVIVLV